MRSPARRSPPGEPLNGAANGRRALPPSASGFLPSVNFSANHLFLLSRTEYSSCAVFLLRDLDTQRVYRLHEFTKAQLIRPGVRLLHSGQGQTAPINSTS